MEVTNQIYKNICAGNRARYKNKFINYFLRILKGNISEIILRIIEENVKKFYEKADRPLATKE